MLRIAYFLILLFFVSVLASGQIQCPEGYFRSPLDIPHRYSGTFAELRSNHFHSGIDFRTNGVEGKKIYAVADGYVSRIKVSPYGYGRALYVTHPGGYVSVYAHLSRFAPAIQKWAQNLQYSKEVFAFDMMLDSNKFIVKKGEVLAYSGNSGSSGGPHLHFEIRDEKSEHPLNPFLLGIEVTDKSPPIIQAIRLYPMSVHSTINGKHNELEIPVYKSGNSYKLNYQTKLKFSGPIGLGIRCYDKQYGTYNKNGIYSLSLKVDSNLHYKHQMDEISFDTWRMINDHIDYALYIEKSYRVQTCFISPGNTLEIYKHIENNGIISFAEAGDHEFTFQVGDASGNISKLKFSMQAEKPDNDVVPVKLNPYAKQVFSYSRPNLFMDTNIRVSIPEGALYDSIIFEYREKPSGNFLAGCHIVHKKTVPLQKAMTLWIRIDTSFKGDPEKLVIVRKAKKGWSSIGGTHSNGFIHAKTKNFGEFSIKADSTKPVIKALNVYNGKSVAAQKDIRFQISDNLSGIDSYRGELNGEWILFEYDPKRRLLFYTIDSYMKAGKNQLKLEVTDGRGNVKRWEGSLTR